MFGATASPRTYDAALRDITADRPNVRAAAAHDLARHAGEHRPEVVRALAGALGDIDASVRAAAAEALGDVEAVEAVTELTTAAGDAHHHVRQMALSALGEIGDDRALPPVEEALRSDVPSDRFQAVMAFARISSDTARVQRVLLAATHDEDALVRHIALRVAEEVADDDQAVDETIALRARAMLEDESDLVRVAAAIILGRLGRRDGADILVGVAAREIVTLEAGDEASAIELCGELGLSRASEGLVKRGFRRVLLLQRDPFAWHVRVALAALGHPRAIRWVLDELGAWTRERRSLAVAAAGRGRVQAAKPLLEAMRSDEGRADPTMVAEALARLAPPSTGDGEERD